MFVPSDSLEKISFIQGLLFGFEFIDDCSDVEQVFEKLGQGHLIISKSPKASQRIKAIKNWAYVKQLTQVARACCTDVMQKVAADLDRVEELNDEVKSTHSLTTKIKSVYVASNLDGRTDYNQNIFGCQMVFLLSTAIFGTGNKNIFYFRPSVRPTPMQNFDFLSIWPLTPSHVDANCGVEQRHEDQVLVPEGVSQFAIFAVDSKKTIWKWPESPQKPNLRRFDQKPRNNHCPKYFQ